jgi:hypothetical protein
VPIQDKGCKREHHETVWNWKKSSPREMRPGGWGLVDGVLALAVKHPPRAPAKAS